MTNAFLDAIGKVEKLVNENVLEEEVLECFQKLYNEVFRSNRAKYRVFDKDTGEVFIESSPKEIEITIGIDQKNILSYALYDLTFNKKYKVERVTK